VDRDGGEKESVYEKPNQVIYGPRLGPDGRRVLVSIYCEGTLGQLWLLDPARNNQVRLYPEGDKWDNQMALWSRDGREMFVAQTEPGGAGIYRRNVDRPESAQLWKTIPGLWSLDSVLAGDRGVLISVVGANTGLDIWRLDNLPGAEPRPYLATRSAEHSPEISPDGKWLAYVSDASGREEVYVKPFDGEAPSVEGLDRRRQ